MSVVMCPRCDKMVDLDFNVDDMGVINNEHVCLDCMTEDELDKHDEGM